MNQAGPRQIGLILLCLGISGCHPTHLATPKGSLTSSQIPAYLVAFGPKQLSLMRWTEIIGQDNGVSPFKIKIYASLLDSFGVQIKSPGTFRFELYERTRRSAQIRGKRLILWPDVELMEADINNQYWQDYLRSYQFTFDINTPLTDKDYVLQATFFLPDGNRLTAEYPVKCP